MRSLASLVLMAVLGGVLPPPALGAPAWSLGGEHAVARFETASDRVIVVVPADRRHAAVVVANGERFTFGAAMRRAFRHEDPEARLSPADRQTLIDFYHALRDPEAYVAEVSDSLKRSLPETVQGAGCNAWEVLKLLAGAGVTAGSCASAVTGFTTFLCVAGGTLVAIEAGELFLVCACPDPCQPQCVEQGEPPCSGGDDDGCPCAGEPCLLGTHPCCPGTPPDWCDAGCICESDPCDWGGDYCCPEPPPWCFECLPEDEPCPDDCEGAFPPPECGS